MEICVFYSWQSKYRQNCDAIISKAIGKALQELNNEQDAYHYILKRGGADVLGAEHIDNNIDGIINNEADLGIVDFTHNGNIPEKDKDTGEWKREICSPNTNAVYENGKLEIALGNKRQLLKVYNTAYGDLKTNLDMPFDMRQEHFPIDFYCDDETDKVERKEIIEKLKKDIKNLLKECTKEYAEHQKVRYSPLVPLHNEYTKKLWKGEFKQTLFFQEISDRVTKRQSFRLLGLPGLGKTRMIGEAFRGREIDVYYCDCREQTDRDILQAIEKLMNHRGNKNQTVILDNCSQKLSGYAWDTIMENGYNCQLITIYYDPRENVDSGIESICIKVGDAEGVVEGMLDALPDISKEERETIIDFSGGFPLMAQMMIENHYNGIPIVKISKQDVFVRMLGIDPNNATGQDKLKVLTAFSLFKFIGLYDQQEKHGRFIAGNRIVTNIRGTEEDNLHLFKEVHGQYSKMEILEREGNLVLMRLIPLAIYLCKLWFDKQTIDTISELIEQIRTHQDAGTRNMLIESLSRRITLLAEVPLAKELNDGLTNPDRSPFLSEEVVLSPLGSRLFLAFSEVNPEACAFALYRLLNNKTDNEIKNIESSRRNLAWALDHMAFDNRSFRYAMLSLARLSLVETEEYISNNTTGLFIDRYPILLSGTEVNLKSRIGILEELSADARYNKLIIKSLHRALGVGHFHRTGGAEKQGLKTLKDYNPTYNEICDYLNTCLDMLLKLATNQQDIDAISRILADNACSYYLHGLDEFLLRGLTEIAPMRNFIWEEMNDALASVIKYSAPKRQNYRVDEFITWKSKLTRDDYVYRLLNSAKEIYRNYENSFEQTQKQIRDCYQELACELIDKEYYKDERIMASIMNGECHYYNFYGAALSSYSLDKGVQGQLLEDIQDRVLNHDVSPDSESLLLYFLLNVHNRVLLENTYDAVLKSDKKRLLPAMYAIKSEGLEKKEQLFDLIDNGLIKLADFTGYFNYLMLTNVDVKYEINRLLDYGSEGARIVLVHCHNLLFGEQAIDDEYEKIGRRCLLLVNLSGLKMDTHIYFQSVGEYLKTHHDDDIALHIQLIQEDALKNIHFRNNYYLERLYRSVLTRYTDLLQPRIFCLLENREVRHSWIELLRTCYSQDEGEANPNYTLIPSESWFNWLEENCGKDRIYALAMIFSLADSGFINEDMLKLIDRYWGEEVEGALSARLHSYSWSGSGIPLYRSRIALCEDYIAKLTNEDAKSWFKKDIRYWITEIEQEQLQNAHERAIYN